MNNQTTCTKLHQDKLFAASINSQLIKLAEAETTFNISLKRFLESQYDLIRETLTNPANFDGSWDRAILKRGYEAVVNTIRVTNPNNKEDDNPMGFMVEDIFEYFYLDKHWLGVEPYCALNDLGREKLRKLISITANVFVLSMDINKTTYPLGEGLYSEKATRPRATTLADTSMKEL